MNRGAEENRIEKEDLLVNCVGDCEMEKQAKKERGTLTRRLLHPTPRLQIAITNGRLWGLRRSWSPVFAPGPHIGAVGKGRRRQRPQAKVTLEAVDGHRNHNPHLEWQEMIY